jgi:hypothetical protein
MMSITPRDQLPKEGLRAGEFGLLANGSSRLWDVAVDESLEQEGVWSLELDGPALCLMFRLRDLAVVPVMLAFLQQRLGVAESAGQRNHAGEDHSLTLGTFNGSPVSLLADDESPPRCFLVVGPDVTSTMRLTLQRDDIEMLRDAICQVVDDLPGTAK